MIEELIFHLVPKRKWDKWHQGGVYEPNSLQEEGYIHCSKGSQVNKTANRLYQGERRLMLLVIDLSTVKPEVSFEEVDINGETETFPHIHGPLNMDAIIDKIRLEPGSEGTFDIDFESN